MVGLIVNHFETNTCFDQNPVGVYLAIGLVSLLLIRAIIYNGVSMSNAHLSMQMRVATCDLIYNKVIYVILCSKINIILNLNKNFLGNIMSTIIHKINVCI